VSDKPEAPAVHIPVEHQSAPKESWADKEIKKAAEEIATGQFTPVIEDDDPLQMLSVGVQRGPIPANPNDIDMNSMKETTLLIQHPRVQEALAKLEREKEEAQNTQEFLEKSQMLHELNEAASQRNHWDGQGRWIGRENEEMRIGRILTPFQFMLRLERVIGDRRVFLNSFAVYKRVALLAPDSHPSAIYLPGQLNRREDGLVQVATLQYPCSAEWMVMRFDEYGVPTTAKYLGWRTALLSLIRQDIITEKEAHRAFPLGDGPAGDWYREQLFVLRQQRGIVN
jgi:hypothetical protein